MGNTASSEAFEPRDLREALVRSRHGFGAKPKKSSKKARTQTPEEALADLAELQARAETTAARDARALKRASSTHAANTQASTQKRRKLNPTPEFRDVLLQALDQIKKQHDASAALVVTLQTQHATLFAALSHQASTSQALVARTDANVGSIMADLASRVEVQEARSLEIERTVATVVAAAERAPAENRSNERHAVDSEAKAPHLAVNKSKAPEAPTAVPEAPKQITSDQPLAAVDAAKKVVIEPTLDTVADAAANAVGASPRGRRCLNSCIYAFVGGLAISGAGDHLGAPGTNRQVGSILLGLLVPAVVGAYTNPDWERHLTRARKEMMHVTEKAKQNVMSGVSSFCMLIVFCFILIFFLSFVDALRPGTTVIFNAAKAGTVTIYTKTTESLGQLISAMLPGSSAAAAAAATASAAGTGHSAPAHGASAPAPSAAADAVVSLTPLVSCLVDFDNKFNTGIVRELSAPLLCRLGRASTVVEDVFIGEVCRALDSLHLSYNPTAVRNIVSPCRAVSLHACLFMFGDKAPMVLPRTDSHSSYSSVEGVVIGNTKMNIIIGDFHSSALLRVLDVLQNYRVLCPGETVAFDAIFNPPIQPHEDDASEKGTPAYTLEKIMSAFLKSVRTSELQSLVTRLSMENVLAGKYDKPKVQPTGIGAHVVTVLSSISSYLNQIPDAVAKAKHAEGFLRHIKDNEGQLRVTNSGKKHE